MRLALSLILAAGLLVVIPPPPASAQVECAGEEATIQTPDALRVPGAGYRSLLCLKTDD